MTSSRIASSSRPSSSICSSVRCASGLLADRLGWPSRFRHLVPFVGSECDLDRPSGGVDAGAHHLALARRAPRRCAGREPARASRPTQVWQIPSGSRREAGAGVLAGRRGSAWRRRTSASTSLAVKRACRPAVAGVAADHRLEALHVRGGRDRPRAPSARASRRASRPVPRGRPRARASRAERVEIGGRNRPSSPVSCSVQARSRCGAARSRAAARRR